MELPGADWLGLEQPQCVSCLKLNFRRRNLLNKKIAAVKATMLNAIISCQSMSERYAESFRAQPDVWENTRVRCSDLLADSLDDQTIAGIFGCSEKPRSWKTSCQ